MKHEDQLEQETDERKDSDTRLRGRARSNRVQCADGPYEGSWLEVPPGGHQVIIPWRFTKYGAKPFSYGQGLCIYELRDGLLFYMGQPDQTEAIAEEMERRDQDARETKELWTP